VPSPSSATPFPDNYFDAVISRSLATVVRNDEWARLFFDCMRILKPGGHIEMLTIDPHLSCEGPKLSSWVHEHLSCRLEAHGLSMQASDTVLDTMDIVGLENIRRARIALPTHSPKVVARPEDKDAVDVGKMMWFLGRHFYQDLHSRFLYISEGEEWFWARKDIRDECERYQTKMVLTIACAQKPGSTPDQQ
jgi:SAM-dependent methyltransferase